MRNPTLSHQESRSFPAHPASLFDVREFVRRRAEDAALGGSLTNDLVLAVSEACANAVLHSGSEQIRVNWRIDDSAVAVEVEDDGVFKRRVLMPELEEHDHRGHGIPLMVALADQVDIREGTEQRPGTVVRLVRFRNG